MVTCIRSGTVYLEDGPLVCDLLIADGKIAEIGDLRSAPPPSQSIDARGISVLPGAIDFHVHLDDEIGRFRIADDFESGSSAAICTGVTTLVSFATQRSGETLKTGLEKLLLRAAGRSHCDYTFHLTPTSFEAADWEEIESLTAQGYRTFKFYTTYKEAGLYLDYEHLGRIMQRLEALGCTNLVHCEDQESLDAIPASSLDLTDAHTHALLRSEEAETRAIARVLDVAERSNAALHIVHVSTGAGARLIEKARGRMRVTCETAPHYLLLDEEHLKGRTGHRYLCTPPLRSRETRAGLEVLAARGAFDLFATDHCPFRREDKDFPVDVTEAPKGIAGVGALVPLTYGLIVERHGLDLSDLISRIATNPAKTAGIYPRKGVIAVGSDADLILVKRDGPERPIVSSISRCYETYPDHTTTLDFRYVFLRGKPIVRDNALVAPHEPKGQSIWES